MEDKQQSIPCDLPMFGHYRGGLASRPSWPVPPFRLSAVQYSHSGYDEPVAIPEMKKYKYHPMLSAGSVVAGSTLGVMIPPSIVLVVYAIYTVNPS